MTDLAMPARDDAPRTTRDELGLPREYVAPRTETETALCRIWAEILNLDRIGIHDDFFEIGGDSVTGAVMMAEIERAFGLAIPLSILLEHSVVAALAIELDAGRRPDDAAHIYRLAEGEGLPPLFLVHGAAGIVSLPDRFFKSLGSDLPVFGLQARGLLGLEAPHRTFEAMAAEYVSLVRTVQPHGALLLAGMCIGGTIALEMARQLLAAGEPPRALLLIDPHAIDDYIGGGGDLDALRRTHAGRRYLEKVEERVRGIRGPGAQDALAHAAHDRLLQAMIAVQEGINKAADRYTLPAYPRFMSLFCNASAVKSISRPNSPWRAVARARARLWNIAATHELLMSEKLEDLGRAMRMDIDRSLNDAAAPLGQEAGGNGA